MHPIRQDVEGLLLRGECSGNSRLKGMCQELYDYWEWLWPFLEVDGIEPTNNASERSLRHAVIWRKLSFGTQSARGSRFVETILTVIETCRQQSRSVFDFVAQAVQAHFDGQPSPLRHCSPRCERLPATHENSPHSAPLRWRVY
jgi:transposase